MANRTLAVIRRVYNFGIARDMVDSNPTVLVKAPGKEQRRDRALKEEEIKLLWERIDRMQGAGEPVKAALKLIIITAQRPGEILSMEWSEIDRDSAIWEIPGTKTKNASPHRVPLSPLALEVIDSLPHLGHFVFPARIGTGIDDTRTLKPNALALAIKRNRKILGLEEFTPHDLRRTAATRMSSLGVDRFIISRILNHTERNVTSIYDRYGFDKEKRRALIMWAARLQEIIEGHKQKVIPIAK